MLTFSLRPLLGVSPIVQISWIGLALLTVYLVFMLVTNWGQRRPLAKCLIFSLLAHVVFALYATRTVVLRATDQRGEEIVFESVELLQADEPATTDEGEPAVWDRMSESAPADPATVAAPEFARAAPPLPEATRESSTDVQPPAAALPEPLPEPIAVAAPERARTDAADAGARAPSDADAEPEVTPPESRDPAEAADQGAIPPPQARNPGEAPLPDERTSDARTPTLQLPLDPLRPPASPASDASRASPQPAPNEPRADANDAAGPRVLDSDPTMPIEPDLVAEPYRLRLAPDRSREAITRGATPESERAVELALAWLAAHQNADGRWDGDGFTRHCPHDDLCPGLAGAELAVIEGHQRENSGRHADTGLTGLAVLAFLGAGYTHEEGPYADNLEAALGWLVSQQAPDGSLAGDADLFARMYCHAIAAIALSEAYGMTGDPRLREPVERAVAYILATQNPHTGGWRYEAGNQGDTSVLGWKVMALRSAYLAGIDVPDQAWQGAARFLRSVALGRHGGLASYRPGEQAKPSMTAEALFSRQLLGFDAADPAAGEAVEYLIRRLPDTADPNLYYWYYGTLAMYQVGGRDWQLWNAQMRDTLVRTQRTSGHATGSWDPEPPWGGYGGRVFSTSLSALCLEVYYRYLPLYRLGEE